MGGTLHYNTSVQQQSDWSETVSSPNNTDMSGMVATGDTSTVHYTGTPDALRTLRTQLLGGASATSRKTAVLRGLEGGMADLVVTTATYVTQDSLEPTPGGEGASATRGTDFSVDVTMETVSILTHPKIEPYKNYPDIMGALQMLANGASDYDLIKVSGASSSGTQMELWRFIQSVSLEELAAFVRANPQYSVPVVKYTATRKMPKTTTLDVITGMFKVTEGGGGGGTSGPAEPPPVADRNWLYLGGGARLQGNQIVVSKNWILSNKGGWDEEVYPS